MTRDFEAAKREAIRKKIVRRAGEAREAALRSIWERLSDGQKIAFLKELPVELWDRSVGFQESDRRRKG